MTNLAVEPQEETEAARRVRVETPFQRFRSEFAESKIALFALGMLIVIVVLAILAPWITPQNPYDLAQVSVMDGAMPPGEMAFDGYTMWLGSDGAGRDLYSAILYGIRISLMVGLASGLIALIIGTTIGLIAAYSGGRMDTLIMRAVDLQLSFPAALIALMLVAVLGRGIDKIIIALVVAQWAYYARTVRATALVESAKEYIEAARCLGLTHTRVVFRHVLPNCLAPLIVIGAVQTASAIALESTLSFLGVGLRQTEPSLGVLIANGRDYIISGRYWISIFPGVALLLTIVSINLVGDQLRDVLNPRLKR